MSFQYLLYDVFTDAALTGNQLAVFTDARDVPVTAMQRIARELNLSETTFVLPPDHAYAGLPFTTQAVTVVTGGPALGTELSNGLVCVLGYP